MAWEPYVTVDSQDVEALLYLREKLGKKKKKRNVIQIVKETSRV
jgi:hypothetical protein